MTGKIGYTPEAQRHLRDLGDWVAGAATPEIATQAAMIATATATTRPAEVSRGQEIDASQPSTAV